MAVWNSVKRAYARFCRFEMWLASALLIAIATLVFVSAIARFKFINHPINWAVDISMLLFAWLVFIGGDIVVRETNLVCVDVLVGFFPPAARKALMTFFYILMLVFLAVLVRYGVPLLISNWKRQFQDMQLSYSWCTLSVPTGAVLMMISCSIRLVRLLRTPAAAKTDV